MIPAFVTFLPDEEDRFTIATFTSGKKQDITRTAGRQMLDGNRAFLEREVSSALALVGEYPQPAADQMLTSLDWGLGVRDLVTAAPAWIKYTMSEDAWPLLPEMMPISGGKWLDQLCPGYRTLDRVEPGQQSHLSHLSLAILFQEDDPINFATWANEAKQGLRGGGLVVDTYRGSEFTTDPGRRAEVLHEIFHCHRAVLFLGHLTPGGDGRGYGWGLASGVPPLLMSDLQGFLGSASRRPVRRGNPIPEVVFAGCCAGAWRDPARGGRPGLPYPKVFLDAGVRFFVGAWMNVIGPGQDFLRRVVVGLAVGFFNRWSREPDYSVHHLFAAKVEGGFPLPASLFQIYALGSEDVAPPPVETSVPKPTVIPVEPKGGVISAVAEGDRLGDYRLLKQLWADSYSRTFWAATDTSSHLVQILTDEWQSVPEIAGELQTAASKLQEAHLGEGHLTPARCGYFQRSLASDLVGQKLLALVYDRPSGETPEHWMALRGRRFDVQSPTHFMEVLRLGVLISLRLSELHARNIRHGNLAPSNVLFRCTNSGEPEVVIKDAWLRHTRPGRCTHPRYGAPEERAGGEGSDELKADCWGMGVILFELATGSSPFLEGEADAPVPRPSIRERMASDRVPEALERVVRECLVPSAALRPNADQITRRLLLAAACGGAYLSAFEADLWNRIEAGQRLFSVLLDDPSDLDATLDGMAARGHRVVVLRDGEGLVRRGSGYCEVAWKSAGDLGRERQQAVTADQVLAINTREILREAIRLYRSEASRLPSVVVLTGSAWDADGADTYLAIRRMLILIQQEYRRPVVILTEDFPSFDEDLARLFHRTVFPPLSPADLFERVLSAPRTEGLAVPEVSEDSAIEISKLMHPCGSRELTQALRLGALRYGVVDERVTESRDLARDEMFRQLGSVTYFPVSALPKPEWIGLAPETRLEVDDWARSSRAAARGEGGAVARKRILTELSQVHTFLRES